MKQINIMFLTCSLNIGGTENHIFHLLSNLNKEKFNPVICCLYYLGSIGKMLIDNRRDIRIYHNVIRNKWDILGFRKLMRIFKNEDIHILYMVNSPVTLFYGITCAQFSGVNACLTRMTTINPVYHPKRRKIVNTLSSTFLNRVIAQADSHKRYLIESESFSAEKIVVIYNGVDMALFNKHFNKVSIKKSLGIPLDSFVVGMVGRLAPEKNHPLFLYAAKKVVSCYPRSCFLIIGDGIERKSLESLTDELGIQSNVCFLGSRENIPEIISIFDVAVLTSNRVEVFSNAILEYMAAGKPVVATNVGSIADQVVDRVTGFLIPPDDHEALANRILKLLYDPDLARRMGEAGRKLVEEKFTIQKMVEKYETLFRELIR